MRCSGEMQRATGRALAHGWPEGSRHGQLAKMQAPKPYRLGESHCIAALAAKPCVTPAACSVGRGHAGRRRRLTRAAPPCARPAPHRGSPAGGSPPPCPPPPPASSCACPARRTRQGGASAPCVCTLTVATLLCARALCGTMRVTPPPARLQQQPACRPGPPPSACQHPPTGRPLPMMISSTQATWAVLAGSNLGVVTHSYVMKMAPGLSTRNTSPYTWGGVGMGVGGEGCRAEGTHEARTPALPASLGGRSRLRGCRGAQGRPAAHHNGCPPPGAWQASLPEFLAAPQPQPGPVRPGAPPVPAWGRGRWPPWRTPHQRWPPQRACPGSCPAPPCTARQGPAGGGRARGRGAARGWAKRGGRRGKRLACVPGPPVLLLLLLPPSAC